MLFLFDFHKFEHKYAKVVLRKINVRVSQPKCVDKTLQKQVTKDGQDKRCQAAAKDGHDDDHDNAVGDDGRAHTRATYTRPAVATDWNRFA